MDNEELWIQNEHKEITVITLNRPEKRNALSISLLEKLINVFERLQNQSNQRVVIIRFFYLLH